MKQISIGELERRGAIVAIQDGNHGELHPKATEYVESGVPFVMASDIRDGRLLLDSCKRLPKARTDRLRIGFAKADDVLLTHKGTVGEVAVVPKLDGYLMLTPQVTYYRTDPRQLSNRYLAYAFRFPAFQAQLGSVSAQSTRPYVGITAQRYLLVPFCEPPQQARIAAILSAYDDLIENNARRIAILEEMARRIYEEWFVRFRFPGHENVRMVESELGPVPEGWRLAPLGDLVGDVRDTVGPESLAPDTPYVGLEHIPRRSIALSEWASAADVQSTKVRFRERDILFGKIRPYFHKVAVAPLAGVASSDAIVIRPKNEGTYGLALAVVSSDAFVAEATQTSNGTKMPRANWSVLQRYPVPIPPAALRTRFEELMTGVVSAVANHVLRNRNLRTTRDLLLPKLISGELDVSAMPDPTSAAA